MTVSTWGPSCCSAVRSSFTSSQRWPMTTLPDGTLVCSGNLDAPVTRTEAQVRAQRIELVRAGYLSGALNIGHAIEKLKAAGLSYLASCYVIEQWDEILRAARFIERQRIELGNERL